MLKTRSPMPRSSTPVVTAQPDLGPFAFEAQFPAERFQSGSSRSRSDGAHSGDGRLRWSPRMTLAFSVAVALLLWGAIGLTIYALR